MPSFERTPLEEVLNITQIASCDTFVGEPRDESKGLKRTHLFGGLIAAQSVVAASKTVPATHRIHSLHSYFILAGDGRKRIVFKVSRIRDGPSFKTRQVLALQENRPIFMMIASFHIFELGPEFQRTPEEISVLVSLMSDGDRVKSPATLVREGSEIEYSPSTALLPVVTGAQYSPNHSINWRKHKTKLEYSGEYSWIAHAAVMAYMSDMGLLSTVRQPYGDVPIGMSTSLDHTIHFHRPFRADEWLLFHNETTASSGARGVARTEVWTESGRLVASFMQEGLARPARDWRPSADPREQLAVTAARTVRLIGPDVGSVAPSDLATVERQSELEKVLDIAEIAGCDTFVGEPSSPQGETRTHLFGGHIAAQCIVAACRTVPPTHRIHSLHSYFMLAGDGRKRILFEVSRIRDGASFKTRQVLALQENRPIFVMMASFHANEPGPEFQRTPEELSALLTLLPDGSQVKSPARLLQDGAKIEYMASTAAVKVFSGHSHALVWRKHRTKLRDGDPAWALQAAVLAYMSDMGLLSTVRQPYQETPLGMVTSLDHTIHFHREFRADEWLLFHNETTVSSGARGVARTEVWTDDGYLVASFMQEGLLRPSRKWASTAEASEELADAASRTLELLRKQRGQAKL